MKRFSKMVLAILALGVLGLVTTPKAGFAVDYTLNPSLLGDMVEGPVDGTAATSITGAYNGPSGTFDMSWFTQTTSGDTTVSGTSNFTSSLDLTGFSNMKVLFLNTNDEIWNINFCVTGNATTICSTAQNTTPEGSGGTVVAFSIALAGFTPTELASLDSLRIDVTNVSCTAGTCGGEGEIHGVPEPASMLLFGLGLAGLGFWGRKRLN